MPASRKRHLDSDSTTSVDWLGQLLQMDLASEDGFQIEADPPLERLSKPDSSKCECNSCKDDFQSLWGFEKLEGLLSEDLDFAPGLDDLLQDPLLAEGLGFDGEPYTPLSPPQPTASGPSPASSGNRASDRSSYACTNSAARPDDVFSRPHAASSAQDSCTSSKEASQGQAAMPPAEPLDQRDSQGAATTSADIVVESEEHKRRIRMLRNRESASLSRQRKKMQFEEKENQYQELQRQYANLNTAATQLSQENTVLRQHLAMVCQQAGQPYPPPLLSQPPVLPLLAPPHTMAMHLGIAPLPAQKVPIRRMDAPRPAAPQKAGAAQTPQQRPQKKRRQAVAGGSTALAALFCLFIYCGFGVPRVGIPATQVSFHGPPQYRALPGFSSGPQDQLSHDGRALQAAELEGYLREVWGILLHHMGSKGCLPELTVLLSFMAAYWQRLSIAPEGNTSYEEVILNPRNKFSEDQALQHLKDVAPFAVLSTYDADTRRYIPPAPWRDFQALAGSALEPDGFSSPAACKPIFDFDVSAVDNPKAATQQLQQYLATMDMFKGRYKAMPLPPIRTTIPAIEEQADADQGAREIPSLGCGNESDYIISVMIPTKEEEELGYTQVEKIYVVVLKPNKRYITYSCELAKPILA